MGKEIQKKAEKLGLTKLKLTILYARPKKIRMTFSKQKPGTADTIRDYMRSVDSSFVESSSQKMRSMVFYNLASQILLYVEIEDKLAGYAAPNPANHALQIKIYSDNEEHIRGIANAINARWPDGILPHIVWDKIESKYGVKREDAIAT
jgi:hypothetical protein